MNDSPFINKVIPEKIDYINKEAKVGDVIDRMRNWNLNNLNGYLIDDIIDKIKCIPVSLSNLRTKLAENSRPTLAFP